MDQIISTTKPDYNSLPGFFELKTPYTYTDKLDNNIHVKKLNIHSENDAIILETALTETECDKLIETMYLSNNFEEVGVQGMMDKNNFEVGSIRTSIWSENIANVIWNRISEYLPDVIGHNLTATDWWQKLSTEEIYNPIIQYKPVAISPLMRFMIYEKGNQHFAHYDAGFIYPNSDYRTLKSVVIYLTTNENAATRFIDDKQDKIDIYNRKHTDWDKPVTNDQIINKSECIKGNILLFDHRLCHDVEQYLGNDKRIIIRSDIVYKKY